MYEEVETRGLFVSINPNDKESIDVLEKRKLLNEEIRGLKREHEIQSVKQKSNDNKTWRKDMGCAKAHKHSTRHDESTNAYKSGIESQGCGNCKSQIIGYSEEWIENWKRIYGEIQQT